MQRKVITIFGSSSIREGTDIYLSAYNLGKGLASNGFTICSGGYGGVMEAVSRGAKDGGGHTIGVTARAFSSHRNKFIDEEIRVSSHIERLMKLISVGDGFVVFQGGTGTLLEFVALLEYFNKRLLESKPLVFVSEFWKDVVHSIKESIRIDGQLLDKNWIRNEKDSESAIIFLYEYFSLCNTSR